MGRKTSTPPALKGRVVDVESLGRCAEAPGETLHHRFNDSHVCIYCGEQLLSLI